MAKLKAFILQNELFFPFSEFGQPTLISSNGKSATYSDTNGDRLVMRGTNLTVEGGVLVDGMITSMTMYNSQGVKYDALTEFRFDAENLPEVDGLFAYDTHVLIMSGNDTVLGTKKSDGLGGWEGRDIIRGFGGVDYLHGGAGNDRITGGPGADEFNINIGGGHDTITDFQSPGADRSKHDTIYHSAGSFAVKQRGDDTVIEFDNGTSVTLLDFHKRDLDPGDIV